MQHLYEHGDDIRLKYMDYAARWMSLKPKLVTDVKSDAELICRIDDFATEIYEYLRATHQYPHSPEIHQSLV